MRGIRIIDSALNIFAKIIVKLERGISFCRVEMEENDIRISEYNTKNSLMGGEVAKAEKVITNLRKLTSEI